MSKVHSSAAPGHFDVSPSALRFTEHEQVPGPVSLVPGVIALHPSGGGLDGRPPIPKQLLGGLVKTHHWPLRVVLFVIKVQHILHPGDELPAQLGDAPFLFLPRLEFVFLSIWRTVSREMLPANSIATTLSASRWSVQFTCPSGGLLHAMATRCASCLPLSLRSRPDRGRSLIAASSPSSTNRLRTLATVAALIETASALRYGQQYADAGAEYYERQYQQRALRAAKRRAAQLGYQLMPLSDALALAVPHASEVAPA